MWELNKLIPICVVDEGRVKRERGVKLDIHYRGPTKRKFLI